MNSFPLPSKNVRSYKRAISVVAAVLFLGAVAACLITISGRAAGLGFPWPASFTKIFAIPNAPNLGPTIVNAPLTSFTVNTTNDGNDTVCDATHCSLREAINAANANADASAINFNIPAATDTGCNSGTGVCTIKPTSALPIITQPVIIDGYTQPSASANTLAVGNDAALKIEISGENSGSIFRMLGIQSSDCTVRGLVINRVNGIAIGIQLAGSANNWINGNFIGTNVNGDVALGNDMQSGVLLSGGSNHNIIGTNADGADDPAERNLLSGAKFRGVTIFDDGTDDNTIAGNYIGTNAAGTAALPNNVGGVAIGNGASNNTVGGLTPAARNVISGNKAMGVFLLDDDSSGNIVRGNYIGVGADGTTALGSTAGLGLPGDGVFISSQAHDNVIGGTAAGAGNIIANNAGRGIEVAFGVGNQIRGNSIFSNGSLGIDLGSNGTVAPNDPQDADTGANNLQNFPVITSATAAAGTNTITGTLNSAPAQTFAIDFFANSSCDPSGNGEGQTYLGSVTTAATDANGDVAFAFNPASLSAGQFVTATATASGGDTSEFSACAIVGTTAGVIQFTSSTHTVAETGGSVSIDVTRTGGSEGAVGISYATSDGSALDGSDYTGQTDTLSWADGDAATKTIIILITDDIVVEGSENFTVTLSAATGGATLGTRSITTVTITDNDVALSFSIDNVTHDEADTGQTDYVFTVTKAGNIPVTATVDFTTADGTAQDDTPASEDNDYEFQNGTLSFAPADTTKTITIHVNGDTAFEANETFFVNLSNPSNATLSDNQGQGTITNEDVPDATLVVNTTDDNDDGACTAAHCSLREAINNAQFVTSDPNTINFQIPTATDTGCNSSTGVCTIKPGGTQGLPYIDTPVTIDGYTQTGASANTLAVGTNAALKIEISGENVTSLAGIGLMLFDQSATVRGLVINRFQTGIALLGGGADDNWVNGNYIGTDATGTTALPNSGGIYIQSGPKNNIIGTNGDGTDDPAERNLISGNNYDGITLQFNCKSNIIAGNYIGTNAAGTSAVANGGSGVSLITTEITLGSNNNTIGGTAAGTGNLIAFNGSLGVYIHDSINNVVRGNSIHSNTGLGIDLGGNGVTANDAQDADAGANNLQNFPDISSATVTGGTNTVAGTLNSTPGQSFTLDFYSNASCHAPGGNGEGQTYLGSAVTGTTNANGDVSFTFHPAALSVGQVITATATDSAGNTSEFSLCRTVLANTNPTITAIPVTQQEGSPAANWPIATVTDTESTNGGVTVTVTTANPSNFVTVSNIANDGSGNITADVVAACGATDATFTLTATDGNGATATATLNVTVSANTGPILTYATQSVTEGNSLTITPATGPSDNGSVTSIVLQEQDGYTGGISVNSSTGVVSISNAAPVDSHTITIRATDNCGTTTDATFTLNVNAAVCTAVPLDMVGWWAGDGNPNDQKGSNHGALQAGATFSTGKVDQAFNFNGLGAYLSIPDSADLRPADLAIDAWVNLAGSGGEAGVIASKYDGNSHGWILHGTPTGTIAFSLYRDSGNSNSASTTVPLNTWVHVTGTYDGSTISLFVNGALADSKPFVGGYTATTTALTLGAASWDVNFDQRWFAGKVDEFEVFNRALNAGEIGNIYNASFAGKCRTCTPAPANMVSWWPAENNPNDIAGTNDGSEVNGVVYGTGKVAQAFSFDGIGSTVTVPPSPSLNVGNQITIDFWMKGDATNNLNTCCQGLVESDAYLIDIGTGGIAFTVRTASGFVGTTPVPISTDTWHHIAGTYDGSVIKLYIDGQVVAQQPASGSIEPMMSGDYLTFGSADGVAGVCPACVGTRYYKGLIDEIEIFNRALDASEVAGIANAGNAGKCPFELATHFLVSAPANATAGSAFNFTVTALDQFNSTAIGYRGTVTFTTTDAGTGTSVPVDYTFVAADNGEHTFSATLVTAGNQTVTATDTVNSSITGSSNISVDAAAATHFLVSAPASATAGVSFNFTVTAQDQFNNTATAYAGTVHFTKSDSGPGSAVPADYTFVGGDNGSHLFSATLVTSGTHTVTATDTGNSSITGTSNSIVVGPAAATHFAVSAPANATAGQSFNFTVTAQDQFNNTATGYSGTVTFTKSDSGAGSSVPANYTFVAGDNGAHTFSATLVTAGSQTITATDTVVNSITGTSNTVVVGPAAATHFSVAAPANVTSGTPFNVTVTALDQFNNTATGYAGTVHFTKTDGGTGSSVPADYTFVGGDNGSHVFSVTLVTSGTHTVTATDTVTSSITGTSNTITVPRPTISINDPAAQNEGNFHGPDNDIPDETNHSFTVSLSNPSDQTITVDYATANDTAVAPADYTAAAGTLTFNPGETSKPVTVVVKGDTIYELNEQFLVNLSNPNPNATIGDGQGKGTITNDDAAPTLSITNPTRNEGTTPPGTVTMTFTVRRTGSTEVAATVNYITADGGTNQATEGSGCGEPTFTGVDYISHPSTMLTLAAAGATSQQTISVTICKDSTFEADETFFVNLSNPAHATIPVGAETGIGTITNDDAPPPLSPVNTTDDVVDVDGCNAAHCSLREAINAANASPSAVSIVFAIPAGDARHFYYSDDNLGSPGTPNGQVTLANVTATTATDDSLSSIPDIDPDWAHSWWSILPISPLPTVASTAVGIVIDGYSQTGATADTAAAGHNAVLRIEINGSGVTAGVTNGLTIGQGSNTVKGLVINRFDDNGSPATGNGIGVSVGDTIRGNFIGTDASGTLDLGNTGSGIVLTSSSNSSVGGSSLGDANLISGNDGDGISIVNSNTNQVLGNWIGTKANGVSSLGNGGNGIGFSGGGSVFNTIGGLLTGEGNTIAFNGGDGVQVAATAGIGNSIRGNSIFSNGTTNLHLGIDLGTDGVTPNDAPANDDADTGPNNLQNFPTITLARKTGSTGTIEGTLDSSVSQSFDIDFYVSDSCSAPGNLPGEGQTYLGSTSVVTDVNGAVSFTFHPDATPALAMTANKFITATATSTGLSTSEFSACVIVADGGTIGNGAGDIQFTDGDYTVAEDGTTASITLTRVNGTNGQIQTSFSTSNGTATAGSDYTDSDQTVVFNEGESSKTVTVPIINDSIFEGAETVNLSLGTSVLNATYGKNAAPADPHAAVLTITPDSDAPPTFTISDVTQAEGNAGTTAFIFTVTKTGSTQLSSSVQFTTQDGTATLANADYQTNSGTLNFAAGETTKQITVLINGDNIVELNETFTVHLSGATNAGIADADGAGSIQNDDGTTISINDISLVEGNTGITTFTFTVTLSAPSAQNVTVDFATANDTAAAGSDYVSKTGTVTFVALDTSETITINVNGDTSLETNETFFVNLVTPVNATIADNQGLGTILNDDTPVFQFAQSSYTVLEETGFVEISVTRTGDLTPAVTVDYASSDLTAEERKDYTTAVGTLHFASGQATQKFTVLVGVDSYTETAGEHFQLTLSNASGGAVFGVPQTATVLINDSESPEPDAYENPRNFVRRHYHDFLNREPDQGGLDFWTDQITSCGSDAACIARKRVDVSASFFQSIEFQETGYLVERLYKTAYGDGSGASTCCTAGTPSHSIPVPIVRLREFLADTQQIGKGVVVGTPGWPEALDDNKEAFIAEFVQRARFTAEFPTGMTAPAFVDQLNTNSGGVLSPTESAAQIAVLGGTPDDPTKRAQVLRAVAEDADLRSAEFNRAFVLMQYLGYLRRNPNDPQDTDYSGYEFWLTKLNQFNGNFFDAQMVFAFLDSIEYKARYIPQ